MNFHITLEQAEDGWIIAECQLFLAVFPKERMKKKLWKI